MWLELLSYRISLQPRELSSARKSQGSLRVGPCIITVFHGECFPLELLCPGLIRFQNSDQTFIQPAQLSAPPAIPVCMHLRVLLLCPMACSYSAFALLPH